VEYDKILIMGDDPEKLAVEYIDHPGLILVYPQNRAVRREFLLKPNIKRFPANARNFPDIESLEVVKNFILYLLNISEIEPDDRVLVLFQKRGERYEISLDMSELGYPSLISALSDRLNPKLTEGIIRLSMDIIRKGREGFPAGALFVVGDLRAVEDNVIHRIANPIRSLDMKSRDIRNSANFDTLREFATMDGATLVDEMGYVTACGVYIKNLSVDGPHDLGGGRHLAAKSITSITNAIGFVVASEGLIRVYRHGQKIYELPSF